MPRPSGARKLGPSGKEGRGSGTSGARDRRNTMPRPSGPAERGSAEYKENAMERAAKEQILGEIKEAFSNVASIVIADYRGLKVPVVTTMRDDFRKAGCHYRVLKNSLVKIAVKGSKMEPLSTLMIGNTAVIWSTETPQTPAQIALKWAREQPKFVIKGGYFEGQLL